MNGFRRGRTIATTAGAAWLVVTAASVSAAATRPEVPTHAMALDSVATKVAGDLLRDAPIPAGRAVTVLTPIRGDTLGALAERIVQRLKDQGSEVRLFARPPANAPAMPPGTPGIPHPDSTTLALDARVDGWSVSYVRRIRSFPFGVKGYERVVSMHAGATLTDAGTGAVVWVRTGSGILRDVVPKSDLAYVAGGAVGIDPPLPTGSGFRFLEPLIVLGVVTGLVVLFYSNRN